MNTFIRSIFALLALLVSAPLHAGWTNIIYNYSRNDYMAGSQNWQAVQQNDQWMYFANKSGVLEYNGNDWKLYTLKNRTDVRAIQKGKDKIYLGGLNEFGYLEPTQTGKLTYVCLSDSLLGEQRNFGNIWYIFESHNSLYFVADNVVIKYAGAASVLLTTPGKITFANIINDVLHIATDEGIYASVGNQFYKLPYSEEFRNKRIKGIFPFKNKFLVATSSHGLYLYDKEGITDFKTEVDDFLRRYELFSLAISDEYIAIGTVLKGLALIDHSGKAVKYINESNGLQNNTVLNVFFDNNQNVWLGLDNGISYILLNSPLTNLYSNQNFYGAGYAAVLQDHLLYLATNRGLYFSPYPVPVSEQATQLYLIDGSQGQIWNLVKIGDDLFCCSDKGLFIVKDKSLQVLDRKTGVWNVSPAAGDPNKIWVSTYDGFYIFEKQNNQWKKIDYVYGYPGSAINYWEAAPRTLWIRTGKEEIIQIKVNELYNKVDEWKHFTPANGAPADAYVFGVKGKAVFCSPTGIYDFNESTQSFNLDSEYDRKGQNFNAVWEKEDSRWYLGTVYVRKESRDSAVSYAHNLPLIEDFQRLAFLNKEDVLICNETGFSLWKSGYNNQNAMHETLSINRVSLSKTGDSLIYVNNFMGEKYVPEIAYIHNTIRFQYGLMSFVHHSLPAYRYKLDNGNWSEKTVSNIKEYSHLSEGEHVFTVEVSLENDRTITDEFRFIILPPWYRSAVAYIVYFLLLVAVFIRIYRWEVNRVKNSVKKETAQKEKEITELKNEQLEMEVKHKNQELANTAINLANKNEILIEIKSDLQKISEELNQMDHATNLRRHLLRLNNKIDDNIGQDDNFKKFEEHFDLLHNNFTKKIVEKYPTLSLNERKMCAFIKMQLSSKEIAPLLNISVRGVETLRYRLRRKFELSREDSLTSFLSQI